MEGEMTHPQTEAKGADAKAAAMDAVGECYAVHSWHAPAVLTDAHGTMTHNEARIALPEPIHTAETWEEAEEWRLGRLGEVKRDKTV